MVRTLTLTLGPHKDGGLKLTVAHKSVDGDEDASETHIVKGSDSWASETALKEAGDRAMVDYFGRLRSDGAHEVAESHIGRAAR